MSDFVRLDFLANVPLNQNANALLLESYANENMLDSAVSAKIEADSRALARYFHKDFAWSFNFGSGDFFALFGALGERNYHICLATSLHQQSFYAGGLFASFSPLSFIAPNMQGIIKLNACIKAAQKCWKMRENAMGKLLLDSMREKKFAFFLPAINQDILTINPLEKLISGILDAYPNALIFIDISLLISRAKSEDLAFLSQFSSKQIIFLCNGESLGLLRPSGFILHNEPLNILEAFFRLNLLRPALFRAAKEALDSILQTPLAEDKKEDFFNALKAHLGENLSLFAPLELTTHNALPLRFKGIKARMLIQALSVEKIAAINGQDCLFGNAKPSFVLDSMGYEEAHTRELLSVSFEALENIPKVAKALAECYLSLRQFK